MYRKDVRLYLESCNWLNLYFLNKLTTDALLVHDLEKITLKKVLIMKIYSKGPADWLQKKISVINYKLLSTQAFYRKNSCWFIICKGNTVTSDRKVSQCCREWFIKEHALHFPLLRCKVHTVWLRAFCTLFWGNLHKQHLLTDYGSLPHDCRH